MDKEYFGKSLTFAKFCCIVAARIPEVDPEAIGRYLADVAIPPFNYAAARYWANRIENILIHERLI